MTREEAIKELTDLLPEEFLSEYTDAIKMGIKALEQEPCEDAISRQDLREPRFIIAENDYQKGWNDALESVYENAPSIQPQPKLGYMSIDDVMSVFDDFMCGEVDEDGMDTFLEMLKDKAEGSNKE